MLEVFILIRLTRALSAKAAERGQPTLWGGLGPLFWIGGEVSGAILAVLLGMEELAIYGCALGLAILGGVVSWVVVSNLPERADPFTASSDARY